MENFQEEKIASLANEKPEEEKGTNVTKMIKSTCPGCKNNIYSEKSVNIECGKCNMVFVQV